MNFRRSSVFVAFVCALLALSTHATMVETNGPRRIGSGRRADFPRYRRQHRQKLDHDERAHIPTITYRLRVSERFKGDFPATSGGDMIVSIRSVDLKAIELPRLAVGEEYLLMTTMPSPAGLSTVVGLGQEGSGLWLSECRACGQRAREPGTGGGNAGARSLRRPDPSRPVSPAQGRTEMNDRATLRVVLAGIALFVTSSRALAAGLLDLCAPNTAVPVAERGQEHSVHPTGALSGFSTHPRRLGRRRRLPGVERVPRRPRLTRMRDSCR